ncbi:MAG: HAD family hydrolase [Spirochaetia bacterium]
MITAFIFDFNGTLFPDTAYHNKAWDRFLLNHGIVLSDSEKDTKIHGKSNSEILRSIFRKNLNKSEIEEMIHQKESIYQKICLEKGMELAPGAWEFLDFLVHNRTALTIATASGRENVEFFFKHLPLENWFDPDLVVFDDGNTRSKPYPDKFLKAMDLLGAVPENTAIAEDSESGIKAALAAEAGLIYRVTTHISKTGNPKILPIIDFNNIDKTPFLV